MKKKLLTAMLVAGFLSGFKAPVQAQSIDLNSSMTAYCVGGSCSTVTFILNVSGSVYVDAIRMYSLDATLWQFGSLVSIMDSSHNDVTSSFFAAVSNGTGGTTPGIQLTAFAPFLAISEPLYITVAMSQYSTSDNLWGNINYSANGTVVLPASGSSLFSTSGTVTPEPGTTVLLATGLLGVAGMAWRRRRKGLEA